MDDLAAARTGKRAVLLLAHGTPGTLDQIPEYLLNVTGGRPLPQAAVEEIRHRYSLIGSSPLTELTLEQGRLLQHVLHIPVFVGMRNWEPYIADAVRKMRSEGVTSAVAICLAPQNSRTSVGLYRRAVFAETGNAMEIEFVDGWADHPKLAAGFAELLEPVWKLACRKTGRPAPVLFTAHSVPCRTIQSAEASQTAGPAHSTAGTRPPLGPDPYAEEAKRTASHVAALLRPAGLSEKDWFFAFQSQGISGGPWIGPTVEDTLTAIRQQGHASVVIQPIGFLCDHVEILYDIDIGFREFAAGIGLEISRPPSLNSSPLLIEALADLARAGLARLDKGRPEATLRTVP